MPPLGLQRGEHQQTLAVASLHIAVSRNRTSEELFGSGVRNNTNAGQGGMSERGDFEQDYWRDAPRVR